MPRQPCRATVLRYIITICPDQVDKLSSDAKKTGLAPIGGSWDDVPAAERNDITTTSMTPIPAAGLLVSIMILNVLRWR